MHNNQPKALLIYNPHAGKKRRMLPMQSIISLEEIDQLMKQYQMPVDYAPTHYPGHATKLAREAAKKGYKLVIAAGGDGTLSESLSGLIGTNVVLGILPLGSFMNVARMLAIPRDLEKAILLIKFGKTRKIDVGKVTILNNNDQPDTHYFLEEAGIGIEARLHYYLTGIVDRGEYLNILRIFQVMFRFYGHRAKVTIDKQVIHTKATLISVANAPYTGAALHLSPKARLNDHLLTVSLYRMSKFELIRYILGLIFRGRARYHSKVVTHQGQKVIIEPHVRRLVHADARVFGKTPAEFEVIPNAVSIITGFPTEATALKKRTYLDP